MWHTAGYTRSNSNARVLPHYNIRNDPQHNKTLSQKTLRFLKNVFYIISSQRLNNMFGKNYIFLLVLLMLSFP